MLQKNQSLFRGLYQDHVPQGRFTLVVLRPSSALDLLGRNAMPLLRLPQRMRIGTAILVFCAIHPSVLGHSWQASKEFDESGFTETVEPNIRLHVNAPRDAQGQPVRGTRLIIFALPNGNTLEQTLGCKMKPGLGWHYDIQHVAAQTRLLRTLFPDEQIVLVCAEAPGLSWPAFRKNVSDPNEKIAKLVEAWRKEYGTKDCKVTLTGHSGGGAFILGTIEGSKEIPAYIERIAFLDANYSFDAGLHAKKFEDWLRADAARRLIVVCYDDREITYNGKKVVGPDGGTYRATGRMREAFGKAFPLTESVHELLSRKPGLPGVAGVSDADSARELRTPSASERPPTGGFLLSNHEPFQETIGLNGRIHFYIHPNPQNKILHTALVGDMNGLLQIATLGTSQEGKWGTFGGPRAYTKFIQAEPTPIPESGEDKPSSPPADGSPKPLKTSQGKLSARLPNAIGGQEFVRQVAELKLKDREVAIAREILGGNFPDFLRKFKKVELRGKPAKDKGGPDVSATIEVMPDYLAIGSDADFVRMPMTPQTAQRIADQFGCTLPTRKMVDAIDAHAELRIAPHPMTEAREAVATFAEHNRIIDEQRGDKPLGLLTCGIKKDIVLTPRIFEKPQRLAIYGWRQLDGQPIQPLTIVHWNQYVDYSHGVRLVRDTLEVDGQRFKIAELLADPERCSLVSDEGPMNPPHYPAE